MVFLVTPFSLLSLYLLFTLESTLHVLVRSLFSLTHSSTLLCSFFLPSPSPLPMWKKNLPLVSSSFLFSPASLIQRREGGLEMRIQPLVVITNIAFSFAGRSKMKQGSKGEREGEEEEEE